MIDSGPASRLRAIQSDPVRAADQEQVDDCGAFGWLRGIRERALMLEVRERGGEITLLNYAYFHPGFFDPSGALLLQFGAQKVVIKGENLGQEVQPNVTLLSCLARHRAIWISESKNSLILTGTKVITIESIQVIK
jgi:hypothetical protein